MKTFRFIETEHQVHILYSLSCCTFYKIVDRTHHNDTSGSQVNLEVDIYVVAALYTFCLRAYILVQNTDECFICIIFIISGPYFFIGNFFLQRSICGHQNSSVHRNQMWRKIDQNLLTACISQLILDLRCMTVSRYTIRLDVLIYFTVKVRNLCPPSCS